MSNSNVREIKVLPFEAAQGHVPGHAINVYHYDWLGEHAGRADTIEAVVFERWDDAANMMLSVSVHVSRFTEYLKKSWPRGGSVTGVRLASGKLIHAKSMHAAHGEGGYEAAPILCRDAFKVVGLGSAYPLVEVAGVNEWLYSKRRPEDASLVLDPWARDNLKYHEWMDSLAQKVEA